MSDPNKLIYPKDVLENDGEPDMSKLDILKAGVHLLTAKKIPFATSLLDWHAKKGFLTAKQWKYVKDLADLVPGHKLIPDFTQGINSELEQIAALTVKFRNAELTQIMTKKFLSQPTFKDAKTGCTSVAMTKQTLIELWLAYVCKVLPDVEDHLCWDIGTHGHVSLKYDDIVVTNINAMAFPDAGVAGALKKYNSPEQFVQTLSKLPKAGVGEVLAKNYVSAPPKGMTATAIKHVPSTLADVKKVTPSTDKASILAGPVLPASVIAEGSYHDNPAYPHGWFDHLVDWIVNKQAIPQDVWTTYHEKGVYLYGVAIMPNGLKPMPGEGVWYYIVASGSKSLTVTKHAATKQWVMALGSKEIASWPYEDAETDLKQLAAGKGWHDQLKANVDKALAKMKSDTAAVKATLTMIENAGEPIDWTKSDAYTAKLAVMEKNYSDMMKAKAIHDEPAEPEILMPALTKADLDKYMNKKVTSKSGPYLITDEKHWVSPTDVLMAKALTNQAKQAADVKKKKLSNLLKLNVAKDHVKQPTLVTGPFELLKATGMRKPKDVLTGAINSKPPIKVKIAGDPEKLSPQLQKAFASLAKKLANELDDKTMDQLGAGVHVVSVPAGKLKNMTAKELIEQFGNPKLKTGIKDYGKKLSTTYMSVDYAKNAKSASHLALDAKGNKKASPKAAPPDFPKFDTHHYQTPFDPHDAVDID